jgi:hypothetical protein
VAAVTRAQLDAAFKRAALARRRAQETAKLIHRAREPAERERAARKRLD